MERPRFIEMDPPRHAQQRSESLHFDSPTERQPLPKKTEAETEVGQSGTQIVERWLKKIEENRFDLGVGRTAEVFYFEDENNPEIRKLCIKLMLPDGERHLNDPTQEMELLSQAAQAGVNVPRPFYAFKDVKGAEGLLMQTIEGPSLEDIQFGRKALPDYFKTDPGRLIDFRRKLDEQIDRLHEIAGIQHRDLHAGNIMMATQEDGTTEPYIIDFGKSVRLYGGSDEPYQEEMPDGKIRRANSDWSELQVTWDQFIHTVLKNGQLNQTK